jgi:AAA+ ATPase superfamily predicted ATPase
MTKGEDVFVGRSQELTVLEDAYATGTFQMVVVYGRRRVGKSTLLRRFVADKPDVRFFQARETIAVENLRALSAVILGQDEADQTLPSYSTFEAALDNAFRYAESHRIVLVIDEYPYLAQSYPGISSLLQNLIDRCKGSSHMMLVLCGSSMSFMEHQVLGSKSPLYGRRTAQLKVKPFDAFDSAAMLAPADAVRSVELYSLVGGVPLYLEQLDGSKSTEWNLANRILGLSRYLYAEPENYLSQEVRTPALYNAVISSVARGCTRPVDIKNDTGLSSSAVAGYLKSLEELGVIERIAPVGDANRKHARYRICDQLFLAHFSLIARYAELVERGMERQAAERIVRRDLSTYVGHAFEDVSRQWLTRQMTSGDVPVLPLEVGRWWGTDPRRREMVDVDVAAVGLDGELVAGECKWEARPTGSDVLGTLANRAELVCGGVSRTLLFLFSKSGFTDECKAAALRRGNVRLVTVDEMFGL